MTSIRGVILALLLCLAAAARGQTTPAPLAAHVGWGDVAALDRWNPLFVSVQSPQPTAVWVWIELHQADGAADALLLRQRVVAQQTLTVYPLQTPVTGPTSQLVVSLVDIASGKTLASTRPTYPPVQLIEPGNDVIGFSGDLNRWPSLATQWSTAGYKCGSLYLAQLPVQPIGYDAITLLVLGGGDLRQLGPDQQQAILQWVSGGGNLLLWPGVDPLPADGPLLAALPAEWGENTLLPSPEDAGQLNGRNLTPRPGAQALQFGGSFDALRPIGYSCRHGLGVIAVLPMDLSDLLFANDNAEAAFWRSLFQGLASAQPVWQPVDQSPGSPGASLADTPLRRNLDRLDAALAPAAGSSWRGWLLPLALLGLLAGPVDSILLFALHRSPRTPITIVGWLAFLIGGPALLIVPGPPRTVQVSTLQLVDQADGRIVAGAELAAIAAPRDGAVEMSPPQTQWWRVVPYPMPPGQHADDFADFAGQQDQHGCWPDRMLLLAGHTRFVRADDFQAGQGLCQATLHIDGNSIRGSITNTSDHVMHDLRLLTAGGNCTVHATIEPGKQLDIAQVLGQSDEAGLFDDVGALTPGRSQQIDRLIHRGGVACLITQYDGPTPDAIVAAGQVRQHWHVLRALVPVR